MNIAILGGTGFIGSYLTSYFMNRGHHIILLARSQRNLPLPHPALTIVDWPRKPEQQPLVVDAIINLAGETINQRWTKKAKESILQSRIHTTRQLVEAIGKGEIKTNTLLNGSAIGIYGTSETGRWTEQEQPPGPNDFLASVVQQWEEEAEAVKPHLVRLIKARLGVVFGGGGGALPKMMMPYRLFVGGPVGSGWQPVSWIHLGDVAGLVEHCLTHAEIEGAVNFTSPTPVTMDELGRKIAEAVRRPHWIPAPAFAFQLLFGEMSELLLKGQWVYPEVALKSGYAFRYPELGMALQHIVQSKEEAQL